MNAPVVEVETWIIQCGELGWLALAARRQAVTSTDHPHRYAARAAVEAGVPADVVHSTSWRMVGDRLVLTYLVVTQQPLGPWAIDIHRDHGHECEAPTIEHLSDPPRSDATAPPPHVAEPAVLHHALHHLALLARSDAAVRTALSDRARASLERLAPAPAGVLVGASA